MVSRILAYIDSADRRGILTGAIALLILVAVLDFLYGEEVTSSVFYLLPVAMVSWRFDIRVAGPFALVATLSWVVVSMALGLQYSSLWFAVWDGISRFLVYFTFAVLIGHVRRSLVRARELALTDHLTGVANARFFRELATRELEHCLRHNRPFTLAYIDIDDLKDVNDEIGHSGGDQVIRTVAEALAQNIRKVDHVARQGGDEFMLFLHEVEPERAERTLKQIHERVSDTLGKQGFAVSLSVGGVTWVKPPATLDAAIHAADQVMYAAKRMDKGVVLHTTAGRESPGVTPPANYSVVSDTISPASQGG